MCEAQERNEQACYAIRGMAANWVMDIPRILQLLTGDCQHEEPMGSIFLPENIKGET